MTRVPWFRGGFRETRNWLRRLRQKIRAEKRRGRKASALIHEDLPDAEDALERCIRLRSYKLGKEDSDPEDE